MNYSADFMRAVTRVLAEEGGYSDDPRDPGGETNLGISKRAHPEMDIANLTMADAMAVYHRDYWLAAKCDQLPAPVNAVVFDAAVNQGVGRAIQMLQAGLGLNVDGVVGPKTIAAAARRDAVVALTTQRILHYAGLPAFRTYGKGWTARAIRAAMGVSK